MMLTYLLSTWVYLIRAMLPFLLCCVALGGVLPGRMMIKAVALSLLWYLCRALMPSLYFGNHLMETMNNSFSSLFSSESQSVEETENGTFPFFFCGAGIFFLVTITLQYLDHPWVTKILLLVLLKNIVSAFSKVNQVEISA